MIDDKRIRYAAYVRVSSEEQVDGYSLDAQERIISDWVGTQNTHLAGQLVAVYRDEGHSARTDDRPAFQGMIADARAGQYDAIVVHKFDRLARDRADAVAYKTLLRKELGIKVLSVTEPSEDTDGSLGMLVEGMLEVSAQWYSLNLSAETRKGKQQKAKEGLWHGAIPTGYCNGKCLTCKDPNGPGYCSHAGKANRSDGRALIPHPIESEAIRLAFDLYSSGRWSDRDIAHKLNEARYEAPDGQSLRFRTKFHGRKGSTGGPGAFTKDTVKDILKRPFYVGLVEYYGTDRQTGKRRTSPIIVRQGKHEPLVSLALFQKCQDVRRNRGNAASCATKKRKTRVYPLAGILVCDECGAAMRAHGSKGRRYYRCRTRIQRKEGCSQLSVRADSVESSVDEIMLSLVLPPQLYELISAYVVRDEGLDEIEAQRISLQARLDRATELYMAGSIDRKRFDQEKAEYERGMAELQLPSPTDAELAGLRLDNFADLWAAATPLERKGLLSVVFREIRVRNGQVVRFIPAPPFDKLLSLPDS